MYEIVNKTDKSSYIINEVLPMVNAYISALQEAGYTATDFFDPEFTIDTGIICNLGRAVEQFKGITLKVNEPLTPVHERNYGSYNSKMSKEGTAWRLSCDYNNKIVIDMYDINVPSNFALPKILFVKNRIVILLTNVNTIIAKKPTIHLNAVIFSHILYFLMYAPNKYTIISQIAE